MAGRTEGETTMGRAPTTKAVRKGRRALLPALLTAAIVVPLAGAARPGIPAPPPAAVAPLAPSPLPTAYEANRANATEAARMAAAHGDDHRAAADRALAAPSRHLLSFDGR